MKQKIRQILYDLRHQRVISYISLSGTALAIFLLMTVVMMQEVLTASYAPLNDRENLLYSSGLHFKSNQGWDASGYYASKKLAEEIYGGLEGIDKVSYYHANPDIVTAKVADGKAFSALNRAVDDAFWSIYDFDLVDGRYFTKEEVDADAKVAVISRGLAEKLFGKESPVGKEIISYSVPYQVVGVIEDVTALATQVYANFYTPIRTQSNGDEGLRGDFRVVMHRADGYPLQKVRDQVKARYAVLQTRLDADSIQIIYHQSPYDAYDMAGSTSTNRDPEPEKGRTMRLIIYTILLVIPAVNLSSMTHSRLRRRISEIGVRRAFGCTRTRIIAVIITENFIITLIGAIIGLIACIIFTSTYNNLIFSWDTMGLDTSIPLDALINFKVFGIALALCLVLNIISASLPAWLASRVNPVEAINARSN